MIQQNTNIYKQDFPKFIMERKRQVKKYGNSWVITLFQSDIKDLDLKEGDWVDIEEIYKLNKQEEKQNGRTNRTD